MCIRGLMCMRGLSWLCVCLQVWQWLHHKVKLDDGQVITRERFGRMLDEEMDKLRRCPPLITVST